MNVNVLEKKMCTFRLAGLDWFWMWNNWNWLIDVCSFSLIVVLEVGNVNVCKFISWLEGW